MRLTQRPDRIRVVALGHGIRAGGENREWQHAPLQQEAIGDSNGSSRAVRSRPAEWTGLDTALAGLLDRRKREEGRDFVCGIELRRSLAHDPRRALAARDHMPATVHRHQDHGSEP